ncbi:helix-turn-helix domain-containing protein [Actinoplanes sp. DH11]|uniref:helix-turn-helix domain-containing protein n=1 Tax=Actinoplanes sp. DH11 TaxID=2857011 RepID=UPI0035B30B20
MSTPPRDTTYPGPAAEHTHRPKRTPHEQAELGAAMATRYLAADQPSIQAVANAFGVSYGTAHRLLTNNGTPLRAQGGYRGRRRRPRTVTSASTGRQRGTAKPARAATDASKKAETKLGAEMAARYAAPDEPSIQAVADEFRVSYYITRRLLALTDVPIRPRGGDHWRRRRTANSASAPDPDEGTRSDPVRRAG